jgi:hypothetical protein
MFMRIAIQSNKILTLFLLVLSFYGSTLFSQVLGDYKSAGNGLW